MRRAGDPPSDRRIEGDAATQKRAAAIAAVQAEVRDGMVVGLGTGSTAEFMLEELGRRVRDDGLAVVGVPTSDATAQLAARYGIPLTDLSAAIDIDIDGADEVNPRGVLTKGAGGAMTREKCVALAAARLVVIVDASKIVTRLAWPVPVEVLPFAVPLVERALSKRFPNCTSRLRTADGATFVTDNGNHILEVAFEGRRPGAAVLDRELKAITGVVEHGLFVGLKPVVYIGTPTGVRVRRP